MPRAIWPPPRRGGIEDYLGFFSQKTSELNCWRSWGTGPYLQRANMKQSLPSRPSQMVRVAGKIDELQSTKMNANIRVSTIHSYQTACAVRLVYSSLCSSAHHVSQSFAETWLSNTLSQSWHSRDTYHFIYSMDFMRISFLTFLPKRALQNAFLKENSSLHIHGCGNGTTKQQP